MRQQQAQRIEGSVRVTRPLEKRVAEQREELESELSAYDGSTWLGADMMREIAGEMLRFERDPKAFLMAKDAMTLVSSGLSSEACEEVLYPALAYSPEGRNFLALKLQNLLENEHILEVQDRSEQLKLARALGQTDEGTEAAWKILRASKASQSGELLGALVEANANSTQYALDILALETDRHSRWMPAALKGRPEATQGLMKATLSNVLEVSAAACSALSGEREAQDVLITAAEDAVRLGSGVFEEAFAALKGQRLADSNVPRVLKLLQQTKSHWHQKLVLEVLHGDERAEAKLAELFLSSSKEVHRAALVVALRGTKDEELRAVLLQEVEKDTAMQYEAAIALGLSEKTEATLSNCLTYSHDRRLKRLASECLSSGELSEDTTEILIARLANGAISGERAQIVQLLSGKEALVSAISPYLLRITSPAAARDIAKVMASTAAGREKLLESLQALPSKGWRTLRSAVFVELADDPRVEPEIKASIQDQALDFDKRTDLIKALGETGKAEHLLTPLLEDPNRFVRSCAATYVQNAEATRVLAAFAYSNQDPTFQQEIAEALAKRENALEILREVAEVLGKVEAEQ